MFEPKQPKVMIKKAAELSGYPESVIRRAIHKGALKAHKPDGEYYIEIEDLINWTQTTQYQPQLKVKKANESIIQQ